MSNSTNKPRTEPDDESNSEAGNQSETSTQPQTEEGFTSEDWRALLKKPLGVPWDVGALVPVPQPVHVSGPPKLVVFNRFDEFHESARQYQITWRADDIYGWTESRKAYKKYPAEQQNEVQVCMLYVGNGGHFLVTESPDEIMRKLYDAWLPTSADWLS